MGTGSSPGLKSGRGVTLTPHPLLVPCSWKGRAIPLLPLWAVRPVQSLSACTRVHFTFTWTFLDMVCHPVPHVTQWPYHNFQHQQTPRNLSPSLNFQSPLATRLRVSLHPSIIVNTEKPGGLIPITPAQAIGHVPGQVVFNSQARHQFSYVRYPPTYPEGHYIHSTKYQSKHSSLLHKMLF